MYYSCTPHELLNLAQLNFCSGNMYCPCTTHVLPMKYSTPPNSTFSRQSRPRLTRLLPPNLTSHSTSGDALGTATKAMLLPVSGSIIGSMGWLRGAVMHPPSALLSRSVCGIDQPMRCFFFFYISFLFSGFLSVCRCSLPPSVHSWLPSKDTIKTTCRPAHQLVLGKK